MNASTIVADRLIERGIYLERYKSGFNRQILDALETLENDLTKELAVAFSKGGTLKAQTKRLENLLADTRLIIKTAYKENADKAGAELLRLAQNEQTCVVGAMNHAMGIDLAGSKIVLNPLIVGATARQIASGIYDRTLNYDELKALTDGTLIQGAKSAEWWSRQSADLTQKFSDQMRQGVLRGETLDQFVARVRGTRAKLYTDGIMQGTRRNTEALVRTSVQAVANSTRMATFQANSDLVSAICWLSVMDARTSLGCVARNGKCWDAETLKPIGHNIEWPGVSPHWGCRATQTSVLKSFKDISAAMDPGELDAEFKKQLEKQGFSPDEIAKIKRNTRASMDGQVPADITFDKWLGGKAPAFQDELLGKGRGKLFRDGKITLTDLIDQSGRPLTIDELERLSQPRPRQRPVKL